MSYAINNTADVRSILVVVEVKYLLAFKGQVLTCYVTTTLRCFLIKIETLRFRKLRATPLLAWQHDENDTRLVFKVEVSDVI